MYEPRIKCDVKGCKKSGANTFLHQVALIGLQLAKLKKRVFLSCYCNNIYRVQAVGLKNYNYTYKTTIFVNM